MEATKRRDTKPERELRAILHKSGLRYRVDFPIAGTRRRADVAFPRLKVAVFVDGCFWHGCIEHGTWPKANAAFWRDKIEVNRRRDVETTELLVTAGWTVVRIWEHEDMRAAAWALSEIVNARRLQEPFE